MQPFTRAKGIVRVARYIETHEARLDIFVLLSDAFHGLVRQPRVHSTCLSMSYLALKCVISCNKH